MNLLRVITILASLLVATPHLRAERFATIGDAQKVIFPNATIFDSKLIRYTRDDLQAVEDKTGLKMQRGGNRVWLARDGTNLLGVLFLDQVLGKHDLIDYAVGIDMEGRILAVEILEYRESYGGEIRSEKWRDQFKGKTVRHAIRLNRDISNLSGATISCRNVTEGVKRLTAVFELILRDRLLRAGGLP